MQSEDTMDTKTVSLDITNQQSPQATAKEDRASYGHWLGFWYGWWLCWWAGFTVISVPASFLFSFLGHKLCCIISTVLRKLGSSVFGLNDDFSKCDNLMNKRNKEESSKAEGFSETSRWLNLMPGFYIGVVIGIFQIINCLNRNHSVDSAIFGLTFGLFLMVLNGFFFKIVV